MHELTLAGNLLKIVRDQLSVQNGLKAVSVRVVVGELSGVMKEALREAVSSLVKDTALASLHFVFITRKAKIRCLDCGREVAVNGFVSECPGCHSSRFEMISGRELFVKSITFE